MDNDDMLGILACPRCKGNLDLRGNRLVCRACRVYYRIENDIPVLLIEEGKPITSKG